jgi:opacity protein-like surface antigen
MLPLAALFAVSVAHAADDGFYGGLTVRPTTPEVPSQDLGDLSSAWTKLTPGVKNENAGGTLLYGGYRFKAAPLGVEAAISNTAEAGRLGLKLDPIRLGFQAGDPRNWNLDVFTNVEVNRSVGLYGRMGYGYNDAARNGLVSSISSLAAQDSVVRKNRDGFNYGLGLRYDMNRSLGLRLEWSRFSRFGTEAFSPNTSPDNDQLSVGVQYRF